MGLSYSNFGNVGNSPQTGRLNRTMTNPEEEKKRYGFKHFDEFKHMEEGDIIVTIEHCN